MGLYAQEQISKLRGIWNQRYPRELRVAREVCRSRWLAGLPLKCVQDAQIIWSTLLCDHRWAMFDFLVHVIDKLFYRYRTYSHMNKCSVTELQKLEILTTFLFYIFTLFLVNSLLS